MKLLLIGLLWLYSFTQLYAGEEIILFSYQHKPPYILDEAPPQGIYFDLARELNNRLPQYTFVIRELPRTRLDYLLARNKLNGLVIGANPTWFADASRHFWTHPIIEDANLLVSRLQGTGSRLTLNDLEGKRIGLIAGHHYPALDDMLWERRVLREDASTEYDNLQRLTRGWIDATVVGERTLHFYLKKDPTLSGKLHAEEQSLGRYQRHLLVPPQYRHMVPALNEAIDKLQGAPSWQRNLQRYE